MIRVKFSTPLPEFPMLERQTPGGRGIWGNVEYSTEFRECDWWLIYDGLKYEETVFCPPENTIFVTAEPPPIKRYRSDFLSQFNHIISTHELNGRPGFRKGPPHLPWLVGWTVDGQSSDVPATYDALVEQTWPEKRATLSAVISNKRDTPGHRKRYDFAHALKEHFKERLTLYGRGIEDLQDKWNGIAPFTFHLAIENSLYEDYFTEKITDSFLGFSFPFYYGCPNLDAYFPADAYRRIDIDRPAESIETIERTLETGIAKSMKEAMMESRRRVLDQYNLFATIEEFVSTRPESRETRKMPINLRPESDFRGGWNGVLSRLHSFWYR